MSKRLPPSLPVFYHPAQSVKKNNSYSPSAGKPKLLVEYCKRNKVPIKLTSDFAPLTRSDFYLAHDPKYVDGVLDGRIANGFGTIDASITFSLPWTSGSLFAAAEYALKNRTIALSPSSGFHHSCHDRGGSFTTFNGLVIVAQMLHKRGLVKRVGLIDLDFHAADGSEDIINKLGLKYISHYSFGYDNVTRKNAEAWLKRLPSIVRSMSDCDLIILQAAVDPHVKDPLGGVLTTRQMRQRDEIVFRIAKEMGIGIAYCLGGGYSKPSHRVLQLHLNTIKVAMKYIKREDK